MQIQYRDTSTWPDHTAQKNFRINNYQLYKSYGINKNDVNRFGTLGFIIRGHIIQELYNEKVDKRGRTKLEDFDKKLYQKEYEWLGGCEDEEASLDFELEIPSEEKEKVASHSFHVKTVKGYEEKDIYFIESIEEKDNIVHSCPSFGYHTKIQRYTPCKHTIALQFILQDRATGWCNEIGKEKPQYIGKSVWSKYDKNKADSRRPDTLLPSQHPISEELRKLYDKLTIFMKKGEMKSIEREETLLEYAFEEFYSEDYSSPPKEVCLA